MSTSNSILLQGVPPSSASRYIVYDVAEVNPVIVKVFTPKPIALVLACTIGFTPSV